MQLRGRNPRPLPRRPRRPARQPVEPGALSPAPAFPSREARDRLGVLPDPARVTGPHAELGERAAALPRELAEDFLERAHRESPAAASRAEIVESQLTPETLRRPVFPR